MKIYLGTKSSIKIEAVREILRLFINKKLIGKDFKLITHNVTPIVPATPNNSDTLKGAKNRALYLYKKYKNLGDCFIGLESGLVKRYKYPFEECWCFVIDNKGRKFVGYSSGYYLPKKVTDGLKNGEKHIDIMRALERETKIPQKDTWAIYTHNLISRHESIKEATRNAFSSFLIHHS